MLVLGRKLNEYVEITVPPSDKPQTIRVCPMRLASSSVRLGFEAPQEIKIARVELIPPTHPKAA